MKLRAFATWSLALVLAGVGGAHFATTGNFERFIPEGFPCKATLVLVSGAVEIVLAAGLLWPRTRTWAGRGVFLLLLLYTPLHVVDVLREQPVIGPKVVAIIRLPLQGGMLWLAATVGWPKPPPA